MKKLSEITEGIEFELDSGSLDADVSAVSFDSRECLPGSLFFCIPGFNVDGHDYIPEALTRGATTLIVNKNVDAPAGVNVVRVRNPRRAMGLISSAFFGCPSEKMNLAGVTGTNGKTTTVFLIDNVLRRAGMTTGLLGTVENRIGDRTLAVKRTTPESMDLQHLLHMMAESGCSHAVMEVSSHAVALHRIAGTKFSAGVFTNLSQDHLDFHNDVEEYYRKKKTFFTEYLDSNSVAIVNTDDPRGNDIAEGGSARIIGYAVNDSSANIRAVDVRCSDSGIRFRVECGGRDSFDISSPLMGGFNVYNSLAAIAYAISQDIDTGAIQASLAEISGVPGRFEKIAVEGQDFSVIVDYAHSPDGLENVLKAAREICCGRLIVVFGAGGDRDKAKRPIMGSVAANNSDIAIVTSDNPRSEDPAEIVDQIELGVEQAMVKIDPARYFKHYIEIDRFAGIKKAIDVAQAGDVVVIAGKGHEDYQIFRDRTIHFDDREVARNLLMERF